jgi:glycoside/pentoside/hexuronide:cation symporter, GPH family
MDNPTKLPFSIKLAYIAGQAGWSIASFAVMNLLFYFYDANMVDGTLMFPSFLPSIALLSIIAASGRLLDAITDPLIAGLSDQSTHPWGRRRIFMAVGGLPFVIFSVLAFFPPSAVPAWINFYWLGAMVILFYFCMTIYITPYFALIAELGHNSEERLELSTWIAVAWAVGFLIGNGIYAFQGVLERSGQSSVHAFQTTVVMFALISLVLIYLPVIFVDENKYCLRRVSKQSIWGAVKSSFQNRNFRVFALADLVYFIALTFIQTGISYYAIQLLGESKEWASSFMTVLFLTSFLLYVPIGRLAGKWGKKKTVMLSFMLLIAGSLVMALWGFLPIPGIAMKGLTLVVMVFPISAFGFLLYAIAGDIAEADGIVSGNYKEGLFFGTRTFMSKMGNSITLLIFPFVSHLGGGDMITVGGLRMTLVLASLFLILGMFLFSKYDENEINRILEQKDIS